MTSKIVLPSEYAHVGIATGSSSRSLTVQRCRSSLGLGGERPDIAYGVVLSRLSLMGGWIDGFPPTTGDTWCAVLSGPYPGAGEPWLQAGAGYSPGSRPGPGYRIPPSILRGCGGISSQPHLPWGPFPRGAATLGAALVQFLGSRDAVAPVRGDYARGGVLRTPKDFRPV